MKIEWVNKDKAEDVAKLAVCLLNEIIERSGLAAFDVDEEKAVRLCSDFMTDRRYRVLAAFEDNRIVAFGALCESQSLYAEGRFGIVQEFYVEPEYRSQNLGQRMIESMSAYAKAQGWKRLELCTPPIPVFDRTVSFYQNNGFNSYGVNLKAPNLLLRNLGLAVSHQFEK